LIFFDFYQKLPALLIENFTAESTEDTEIELDSVARHGTFATLRPAVPLGPLGDGLRHMAYAILIDPSSSTTKPRQVDF
jgi:hypothetical protein